MVQTGGRNRNHWRTHFYLGISSILLLFGFFCNWISFVSDWKVFGLMIIYSSDLSFQFIKQFRFFSNVSFCKMFASLKTASVKWPIFNHYAVERFVFHSERSIIRLNLNTNKNLNEKKGHQPPTHKHTDGMCHAKNIHNFQSSAFLFYD